MHRRYLILVLILVSSLARSVVAQVTDAAAIADHYLAAMQAKSYSFFSKDDLASRRTQVARFAGKHLHAPLTEATRAAMLSGIDRCIDRLYASPAGKVAYNNGFGSGGEEWMYLNDRDYFLTFEYHLWVGLTAQELSPADAERLKTQHQWMRQYLTDLPFRGIHETPPREGMRNEDVRPWALGELDKCFADPLDLLSAPMPDDGFAKLQERFPKLSNGIWTDFRDMEVAALTSRFPSHEDPAGRYGYTYSGKLPFDDTVIDLWANGPSLHFASNADFRGAHGMLSGSVVFDVVRCVEMHPDAAGATMDGWLAREGRGGLTLDGTTLVAVRGAKMAKVAVKNWFEADKLSDDQLRVLVRDGGDRISIKGLPAMNGPQKGDRSQGEFFIVVQTREGRLAVVNLHNFEFNQLMFWCRPRPATPAAATAPTTKP